MDNFYLDDKPSLHDLYVALIEKGIKIENIEDLDDLFHSGTPHEGSTPHSGRYKWGSGTEPFQHRRDFLSRVELLKMDPNFTYLDPADGKLYKGESAIARSMGLTTTKLRVQLSLAKAEERAEKVTIAEKLRYNPDGSYRMSLDEVAKAMGFANDSSVRSLLNEVSKRRMSSAQATADVLKAAVDAKGMIDVGKGVERELNIPATKLGEALHILEMQGYPVWKGGVEQVNNPGKQTNLKVLCPPGTQHKEIFNYENVHSYTEYEDVMSSDDGASYHKSFEYPTSLDSKRLAIKYAEDGGVAEDGTILLRRGVADLDLGHSRYAQVRIMVDNQLYLKGMARYAVDGEIPDGKDVLFNTNKTKDKPLDKVLKPIKNDPDNPFGSLIKEKGGQSYYDDPNGKYIDPITGKHQSLSLINKRADEGDWDEWSRTLPTQFLSKQSLSLLNRQLTLTKESKQFEFEDIKAITNPTVKKQLLESFADDCDASAIHLKAASLPGQRTHVLMPIPGMKENEIYAPNYPNGTTLALIRYPHAGVFEIPIVKVNNKHAKAKEILGNAIDAIGINGAVAGQLSGADFDGDTAITIPCNSPDSPVFIQSMKAIKELATFDTKAAYPAREGMKYMKDEKTGSDRTGLEMGKSTNLIMDMTLKNGAMIKNDKGELEYSPEFTQELIRAVKYSMVVIDAGKHKLDYTRAYKELGIAELKRKYQQHDDDDGFGGASTLVTRAKAEKRITKRQGSGIINPETGSVEYKESERRFYTDWKTGEVKERTDKVTRMGDAEDAFELVSKMRHPVEVAYAEYANYMKQMARDARLELLGTPNLKYDPLAKKLYHDEVESLKAKLNEAEKNRPRERMAQMTANAEVKSKMKSFSKEEKPNKKEQKKMAQQALNKARVRYGAKRNPVDITEKEWEAIQAGAISDNLLRNILSNADMDKVRKYATPRDEKKIADTQLSRIETLYGYVESDGSHRYSQAEIADILGVSVSTVNKYIKDKK